MGLYSLYYKNMPAQEELVENALQFFRVCHFCVGFALLVGKFCFASNLHAGFFSQGSFLLFFKFLDGADRDNGCSN